MDFTGERYIPGLGGSIALEHEHRYRFCLDLVKGRRVLDIACGEGFGSAMMAEHAERVWGVDIDRHAVAHASANYARDNLRYLVGSCAGIPLPDASVDVVVSFETIEHHDEHDAMMDEIRRVLRPGGVLVISSPDKRTYSDERAFRNEFHVKELYAEEFAALLKSRFPHVTMFGQRIVYGSALLLQDGPGEIRSYGVDQTTPVSGVPAPLFNLAIASDDPSWAALVHGGVLEDTVYRSEAIIERTMAGEWQADGLRLELEAAVRKVTGLQREKTVLSGQLSALRDQTTTRIRDLEAEVDNLRRAYYASTFLRRLSFHRRGKPRGWLRKLLLADKLGTPRKMARRVLFKKNGSVRPIFAPWYAPYLAASRLAKPGEKRVDYTDFLRQRITSGDLALARTVHIVTTPHTEFVGEAFAAALAKTRLTVTRGTEMPASFDHDLYIIVAPQMFATLPPPGKLIVVQMEQVRASRWVDDAYLARMHASLAVLDYSRDNIAALTERGLPFKQLYFVPIRPLRRAAPQNTERDIDVLFYGAIASERRGRYITALREKLNLRVESDTFGPALRDILDRTKIVANIHFYENALLETTRLGEAISHGTFVVSEDAADQRDHDGSYDGMADFVPRNEVDAFVDRVQTALAAWKAPVDLPADEGFHGMTFHVLRALHGIGVLSLDELLDACKGMALPSDRLILALPEQVDRYNFALRNALPGAVPFHGLRQLDGWRGCASSYKFMATRALEGDLPHLVIYEEDATFEPGADQRLTAIETHLDSRDDWDIFSGLLSDLHPEARITAIRSAEGEEFLELDSVMGMVFGIYSRRGLALLAGFEFEGTDTARHTIDRYLESRRPRTLTVWPPLAGHDEGLDSTLWPVNNSAAVQMITDSIARLGEKRAAFRRDLGLDRPVGGTAPLAKSA
jgi:protein-L-isoaspartate O-methyltransferase/GR25 family glycosyltransferase involved in LPS biosynthesis